MAVAMCARLRMLLSTTFNQGKPCNAVKTNTRGCALAGQTVRSEGSAVRAHAQGHDHAPRDPAPAHTRQPCIQHTPTHLLNSQPASQPGP